MILGNYKLMLKNKATGQVLGELDLAGFDTLNPNSMQRLGEELVKQIAVDRHLMRSQEETIESINLTS